MRLRRVLSQGGNRQNDGEKHEKQAERNAEVGDSHQMPSYGELS